MANDDERTTTRRTVLKGIGGLAGASALAGGGTPLSHSGGNTLRYLQVLDPISLDPITIDDPWSAQPASLVFQGLYTTDRNLNLVPVLADGKPSVSNGGKTYTVALRKGPTFQDGTPVTAEDVKYSFRPETYRRSDSPNIWQVEMIDEIRTPDERTVEFRLKHPYPAFENTLTRAVVPKGVRGQNADAFGKKITVGSGPYRSEIFHPGSYAVLSDWSNYWGSTQLPIEKVKMVPNHAGLARSMSLLTNQSDIVERVHPKLWDATENYMGARVVSTKSYHTHFVGFNCSPGGPTRKRKVREAVDYLFSMDDLVRKVVAPSGTRQHSPLPDHLAEKWGFPLEEWKAIPRKKNEEKARRLIEEAGVSGWTPLVATPHDKMREKFAETIVHGLRSLGFGKARVRKYPWPEFRKKVTTGDSGAYDMYIGSWAGFADPDTFMYPLFHDSMVGLTNGVFYQNERFMERIQKARETTKRAERKRLYERAITTVLEDRVHLPAYTLHNSFGVENHVAGFEPHPIASVNPQLIGPSGSVSLRGRT